MASVVVAYNPSEEDRGIIAETLDCLAQVHYLGEAAECERAALLEKADVVVLFHPCQELNDEDWPRLGHAKLVQFMTAGVDFIPFDRFPEGMVAAANRGASAEPMAEHALAMALAAAKRLLAEHEALRRGIFNQYKPNRSLLGATCGILGFGGVGVATARLFRRLDMRILALNRRGHTDEPVDFIGGPDSLDTLLVQSDVLVVAAPLTVHTVGMIGAAQLARMKPDAILVNLARGEIIDEAALFAHLKANPAFYACIEAWWVEPVRHGRFSVGHPFLELPNVIGSPHNSPQVPGHRAFALRHALANVVGVLRGEPPEHLLGPDDRPPRDGITGVTPPAYDNPWCVSR